MYLDLIFTFIALILVAFAAKLLLRQGWLLGFVRGLVGVLFIAAASAVGLTALDLYSYKKLSQDAKVATVSFESTGDQKFRATLVIESSTQAQSFELAGDQWQLDAKVIRWHGLFKLLAGQPGYRLDRISGRYLSLEDERTKPRTVHDIESSAAGLDFWTWSRKLRDFGGWVDAEYGSATFVPMAHGALYQVAVSESGLIAKPINPAAQKAVGAWRR